MAIGVSVTGPQVSKCEVRREKVCIGSARLCRHTKTRPWSLDFLLWVKVFQNVFFSSFMAPNLRSIKECYSHNCWEMWLHGILMSVCVCVWGGCILGTPSRKGLSLTRSGLGSPCVATSLQGGSHDLCLLELRSLHSPSCSVRTGLYGQ